MKKVHSPRLIATSRLRDRMEKAVGALLLLVAGLAAASAESPLVVNGDFEQVDASGAPIGWSVDGGAIETVSGQPGGTAAVLIPAAEITSLSQALTGLAGRTITLTASFSGTPGSTAFPACSPSCCGMQPMAPG